VHRAPSAGFSQGHRLVVVTSPELRAQIAGIAEGWYLERGWPPWIS
jgi:FMN reductase [NAD(P)H]